MLEPEKSVEDSRCHLVNNARSPLLAPIQQAPYQRDVGADPMRGGQIFRGVTREQFLTHDDTMAKGNTGVSAIPGSCANCCASFTDCFIFAPRSCEPQAGTPFAPGPTAPKNLMETLMSRVRRVLLIDDNVDAAESLAQLLMLSGHDARTAGDGVDGIRLAQDFQPEVVFCDLGLPGMSGYEVAKQLRSLPFGRDIVLAALTGYGQPGDREKTAKAGFDAHLVKPVDPSVIESFLDDFA
jgi:CheY-like chemotaxis protein